MIMGDEFETSTYTYITTHTEQSLQRVPVISRQEEEVVFQSPSLESDEEATDDFFTELDPSILITSTPNLTRRNVETSLNDDGLPDEGVDTTTTSLRIDDSSLTSYDGMKGVRKRVTLLQSFSLDHNDEEEDLQIDTLENHLFPDLSFCESEVFYDESQFKTRKLSGDTSWNKLHGVSYLRKHDFSDTDELNADRAINHPNRSLFRQKRRDWYLNRRNASGQRREKDKISYTSKFFHIFLIMYTVIRKVIRKISRKMYITYYGVSKHVAVVLKYVLMPLKLIVLLPWYIYIFIKRKITSLCSKLLPLRNNVSDERKESKFSCLGILCCVFAVIVAFVVLAALTYEETPRKVIPNPIASGIDNAHSIYIDVENTEIPAWHIYPKQTKLSSLHPVKKSLKDTSPVILFLRNEGNIDTPQLKSMYETLFSLGYHIVTPTDIISQSEILRTWKWIKTQTNSTSYLWGFEINATALTETAKVFCKHLIPPNGVIIAKEIKSGNLHQTMEIWSCNCALSAREDSSTTYFKYNHVKCPVAFDDASNDVYSQVVACFETVNKSVDE